MHKESYRHTIKKSNTVFFRKIYLSLYLKGLCVRESWRPNRTTTYWPILLWPSALCLSRSPGWLNRRPGSPAFCWVLAFSTTSCLQLPNSKLLNRGSRGLLLLSAGFLYHIFPPSSWSGLQTDWLPVFTELYNSSIAHSISPHDWLSECVASASLEWDVWSSWSGNNCHAVHRSLSSGASVWVYRGTLTLSHIVSQTHPRQWNKHSFCLWNDMFGGVEGQYTTWLMKFSLSCKDFDMRNPCRVRANALDWNIIVREFVLKSRY